MFENFSKQAFFLLLALLLCLTACQTTSPEESETPPQNSEAPQSSETPNTTEPEGEGNETETPPASPEEPLPKVKVFYSDEPVKVMDKSLYINAFPYQISYTAYLPVTAEETRAGEGETLPVYLAEQYSDLSDEEKSTLAEEYIACLPEGEIATKTEEPALYQLKDTTLSVSSPLRWTSVQIGAHTSRAERRDSLEEWLAEELIANEYLKSAAALLEITEPQIFARQIYDVFGEKDTLELIVFQKESSFSKQIETEQKGYLSIKVGENATDATRFSLAFSIERWTPHSVLAEVPVLSYEDALKNLMSGNAFGTPEFAPQTEESVLACRVIYNNRAMNNAEIKDLGCVYFPVYEFTILRSPGDTGSPRTAYYYVPACNVSAELVAE